MRPSTASSTRTRRSMRISARTFAPACGRARRRAWGPIEIEVEPSDGMQAKLDQETEALLHGLHELHALHARRSVVSVSRSSPRRPSAQTGYGVTSSRSARSRWARCRSARATPRSRGRAASPLLVFNSDISMGPGPGAEVHFGRSVGSRLALEVTGTWTFTTIRAEVSTDFDNAPDATLTEDLSRFSVEGSALWRLAGGAKRALYLRGGAGWMRELTGGATLAETGVIGNVGASVKYWWGASTSDPASPAGPAAGRARRPAIGRRRSRRGGRPRSRLRRQRI